MRKAFARTAVLFFAMLWAMPASADPLLFFLMSAAREIATTAAANAIAQHNVQSTPEPVTTYPGTAVEPEALRRIIDESFGYLDSTQRAEVFDSLNKMLLDPKMGATRAQMIEYFLHKALAVRVAQMELAKLSEAEKRRLAEQFRLEAAALPDDERRKLLGLLERRLLPVPADLNQLLLAQMQAER